MWRLVVVYRCRECVIVLSILEYRLCSVQLRRCVLLYFFFFKQKTAYEMRISDWSSDVCSSDLARARAVFDHDWYRKSRAQLLREDPRDRVGRPPGGQRHDEPDRLAGVGGLCRGREGGQGESGCGDRRE